QSGRDGAVLRETGGMRADRPRLAEGSPRDLLRRAEIGGGVDAPRRRGNDAILLGLPQDRGRRARDARGEADDLARSVLFLERDGQRLTGKLERGARERRCVAAEREGAKDESCLSRAELRAEPLLR